MGLVGPSLDERHIANLCVVFPGVSAEELLGILQPHVGASTGSACTSGTPEPSHVLAALGLSWEEIESCVRFSFGLDHSDEDLRFAVAKTREALSKIN